MVQHSVQSIGQSEPTMKVFNFSESRAALKTILDDVCSDHAPAVVTRQRGDAVGVSAGLRHLRRRKIRRRAALPVRGPA